MSTNFFSRLEELCEQKQSLLCVGLDPRIDTQKQPDVMAALLEHNRRLIEETHRYAVCYKPNIAFYEAFGPPGMVALRESLKLIPEDTLVIIDAKRNDIGATSEAYARSLFAYYRADSITVNPYLGKESLDPFLAYPGKGLFAVCRTSNPGSRAIQELLVGNANPLYLEIARLVSGWGPRFGLVAGATNPEALARIRAELPRIWILAPGIGAQGGSLEDSLRSGLRADGRGILPVAARAISQADSPGEAARELVDSINRIRRRESKPIHLGELPGERAKASLLRDILRENCLKLGKFVLKSGQVSPFYLDLRRIISSPGLLAKTAAAYREILAGLEFDRMAAIPIAAVPITTAISLQANIPFIYPRLTPKAHGTGNAVEGSFEPGERVVLIDDVITTAASKLEAIKILQDAGLTVSDLVVLVERDGAGRKELARRGIRVHAYADLAELLELSGAGSLPVPEPEPVGSTV